MNGDADLTHDLIGASPPLVNSSADCRTSFVACLVWWMRSKYLEVSESLDA